ncbi:hypothetical protein ACFL0W_00750 [Nanoarchaeota archaeon]
MPELNPQNVVHPVHTHPYRNMLLMGLISLIIFGVLLLGFFSYMFIRVGFPPKTVLYGLAPTVLMLIGIFVMIKIERKREKK